MERWEHFNKILGRNDSLQNQLNGIVAEKIKESPETDISTLIPHVIGWLKEEVKED